MTRARGSEAAIDYSIDSDVMLAARVRVPVLITGASRSGREMYARLIHANGVDAKGPFVMYCGDDDSAPDGRRDVPASDHADAAESLRRRFDQATGGSLFIDDITTLTEPAQHELLSLVSPGPQAPDASVPRGPSTARIIAGASHHLVGECEAGAFSELLFYRLNIIHVDLTRRSTA